LYSTEPSTPKDDFSCMPPLILYQCPVRERANTGSIACTMALK
jgi:hypothetical protein